MVKLKLRVKEMATSPSWVGPLLRRRFFGLCDDHKELRKSEVNIFCIECIESMCPHCLAAPTSRHRGRHAGHQFLQIRRYVYQDVIRLHDMQKYVDCSKVQTFIVNGAKVVLLNPKKQTKPAPPGSTLGPLCVICQRVVPEPHRYCSIACKVEEENKVSDADEGDGSDQDGSGPWLPSPAPDGDTPTSSSGVSSPRPASSDSNSGGDVVVVRHKAPTKKRGASRRKGVPRRAQFF